VLRDSTQAIRLEQTRRDYVANVSHELRSPLTALRCLLEPLRDGMIASEDKKQEIYETLLRETLRLSRLVDDMLELSRLQSGALALEKTAFSPLILCRQIADMIEPRAAEGGLSILTDLPDELPICFSNPDRIEQVLIALLDNAIKFTPAGGTVSIGARALVDFVEISVSDTGSGIPPVDLHNVFDRFYKADKAHAGHGTGLGLAIARELMSMLGETIGCENLPEGGARFTFTVHIKNS
jgi:two-component system sensor histidine kinase ResE